MSLTRRRLLALLSLRVVSCRAVLCCAVLRCAVLCVCCVRFFTEVQSHVPEFDCLKSVDVSPRIGALEWWPFGSSHLTLLAANDRSVKVWRVESKQSQFDRQARQQLTATKRASALQRSERQRARSLGDGSDASERTTDSIPSLWGRAASLSDVSGDDFPPVSSRCCAVFRGGHAYSIHSVSSCADGCTFLSADDLRVLLFDLEHSDTACSVLELPAAQPSAAAVDELLTVARFHPHHASLFLHGSSSGCTRIADMRLRLNCTRYRTLGAATTETAQLHAVAHRSCALSALVAVCCAACQGTAALSTRSLPLTRPCLLSPLPPPLCTRCRLLRCPLCCPCPRTSAV